MKTDAIMLRTLQASVSFLIAVAIRVTNTVCLTLNDFMHSIFKAIKALLIERVVNILALAPIFDDVGFYQHSHVVGKCRLCNMERFKNFAGAQLTAGKHIHNSQTLRVGDRL